MLFGIDDTVLTSCRSVLQQWDLPLKIDIYACQHPTTLKVIHLAKKENHWLTAVNWATYQHIS